MLLPLGSWSTWLRQPVRRSQGCSRITGTASPIKRKPLILCPLPHFSHKCQWQSNSPSSAFPLGDIGCGVLTDFKVCSSAVMVKADPFLDVAANMLCDGHRMVNSGAVGSEWRSRQHPIKGRHIFRCLAHRPTKYFINPMLKNLN
jgi:hypothetical protein